MLSLHVDFFEDPELLDFLLSATFYQHSDDGRGEKPLPSLSVGEVLHETPHTLASSEKTRRAR